jgi:hypothetical protein
VRLWLPGTHRGEEMGPTWPVPGEWYFLPVHLLVPQQPWLGVCEVWLPRLSGIVVPLPLSFASHI